MKKTTVVLQWDQQAGVYRTLTAEGRRAAVLAGQLVSLPVILRLLKRSVKFFDLRRSKRPVVARLAIAYGRMAPMPTKPNSAVQEKPGRRWFQFRLRTLLIGMALLGVACAHVANEASIVHARKDWLANHDTAPVPVIEHRHWMAEHPDKSPSAIRRWLGDTPYCIISVYAKADLGDTERLFPEAKIVFVENPFADYRLDR
jgi:hypothetical protein